MKAVKTRRRCDTNALPTKNKLIAHEQDQDQRPRPFFLPTLQNPNVSLNPNHRAPRSTSWVAAGPWALVSLQPLLLELERHSRSDYQLCTDLLSVIRSQYRKPRTVRRFVAVRSQRVLGCTGATPTPPKRCCFDANRGQDLRRFAGPSIGYFSQIMLGWELTNFHCDASRTNFGRRKVCIACSQCDYL